MNVHFEGQRHIADHAGEKLNRAWFLKIFREIDMKGGCIQRDKRMFFLDLGSVDINISVGIY
jgi:hypothetical protein